MDERETVSAAVVCELADISESRHLKWMHERVVSRPIRKGEYTLRQAQELAVACEVAKRLKRLAWIRMAMDDLMPTLATLPESGPLAVVWEKRFKKCRWAVGDLEVADFARSYGWTLTIDVRSTLNEVRAGFQRQLNTHKKTTFTVIPGQSA